MYDDRQGADWLGDQDSIEYMVRAMRRRRSTSSSTGRGRSRAPRMAESTSGRSRELPWTRQGPGASGTCGRRRPHRTRHAAHHVWPGACGTRPNLYIEFFGIDLIMDDQGTLPRGDPRLNLEDGTPAVASRAQTTILCHRRIQSRLPFLPPVAHTCHRRRQRDGRCGRPCRCRTWNSSSSIRPASMARLPRHRGCPRRRRLSGEFRGGALHGAVMRLPQKTCLARRGVARR